MAAEAKSSPCVRCKENEGTLDLRSDYVCQSCFTTYIASKAIKRLEVLQRETRGTKLPSQPQRYLLALSRGPTSTALLHILSENMRRQREKNQRPKYEVVAVFVDVDVDVEDPTSGMERLELGGDSFAPHFPEIEIRTVPLSSILSSTRVDWFSLPTMDEGLSPSQRLTALLTALPTPSARADVTRLLTRHALFAAAETERCPVVLLGYNTTALAELTLSETAKGRGFGIPWLVNDGAFPLPRSLDSSSPINSTSSTGTNTPTSGNANETNVYIYSPLREIFRKEILTYLTLTESAAGPLSTLFPAEVLQPPTAAGAVVSHRDLSLDEVVARYFVDVEASYPSVVANVVRTTGKLNRTAHTHANGDKGERKCGLCGIGLDPSGDRRWKGEIGETNVAILGVAEGDAVRESRLCYGCERSVKG